MQVVFVCSMMKRHELGPRLPLKDPDVLLGRRHEDEKRMPNSSGHAGFSGDASRVSVIVRMGAVIS